jgi:hypothetical protein
MAFRNFYSQQVSLLVRTLPHIADEPCFALKGGTAINLFIRDMPRLSVDIDLTYLPVEPRAKSLTAISAAMSRIKNRIRTGIKPTELVEAGEEGAVTKLFIRVDDAQIKIEVTPVLRGCVFEPEMRVVSPHVEASFGFAEMRVVSFPDLYAGKIVAALDRQHPRDLFDVRDLLAQEGLNDALRKAFVVYLLSHGRPMFEVLAPTRKELVGEFTRGFAGMTKEPVSLEELLVTREALIVDIVGKMPEAHRHFLISFEKGHPEWELLGLPAVADLPAVKWRQQNLDTLSITRRAALVENLENVLFR